MAQIRLGQAIPVLFVRSVSRAASFYEQKLGFTIDFLHGDPPFYGSISRNRARLHLRFVEEPNFSALAAQEVSLILALVRVSDAAALFAEYDQRGVDFAQRLIDQPWGGLEFHVADPDGNRLAFVEQR